MWVRGLKLLVEYPTLTPDAVAHRVSAWIETINISWSSKRDLVASRVGARIETIKHKTIIFSESVDLQFMGA